MGTPVYGGFGSALAISGSPTRTYPRARGSLVLHEGVFETRSGLPTCAEKFGLPALTDKQDQVNYPRVQRSLARAQGNGLG